jgi:CRISPR-associated RAMP protein, Cmr4 family
MIGKYSAYDIFLIKTKTNLHVGTGKGGEIVDLPIQRDSYGFPTIYSSSLKGAIKSYIHFKDGNKIAELLFGSDESGEFASTVALTDAYLLAFPARSLKGVYCYLTSPLLLRRFKEYADMVKYKLDEKIENLIKEGKTNVCDQIDAISIESDNKKIVVINEELILENLNKNDKVGELKKALDLDKELIIIEDDDALQQAERSLIRLTRVKLNRSSKTVESGRSPWTEEYAPPKTIFFTTVFYSKPPASLLAKYKENEKIFEKFKIKNIEEINEIKIREYLSENLRFLIIGGHETIGSGIVEFKSLTKKVEQTEEKKYT